MCKIIIWLTLALLYSASANAIVLITGQHSLESHGYIRSSLGSSEHHNDQAKFQLPGARAKYRLGNEPETNVELEFGYIYDLQNPINKDANIKAILMLDGFKHHGENTNFDLSSVAQLWFGLDKVLNSDVNIWLGRRYYQRKSIHIMNHFWLNPGQNSDVGGGFEGLSAGAGKLDLAVFRNRDDFRISGTSYRINSTVIDARWHDLSITKNSKLTAWAQLAQRQSAPLLGYTEQSGYGIGGWIDYASAKTKNTMSFIYQTRSAITQSGSNPNSVREDQGWNLDKANIIEINNMLTYESLPDYSFQWSLLYRKDDRGTAGNSDITWYSTGIRPIFYLSKHINVALEAGIDYIDDEVNNRSGHLNKFTTALQISADRGLKSRPVLRFFITLAEWDDDFRGVVGNFPGDAPYGNDTSGWTVGTQVETWW